MVPLDYEVHKNQFAGIAIEYKSILIFAPLISVKSVYYAAVGPTASESAATILNPWMLP
jgi:hypothetical protein